MRQTKIERGAGCARGLKRSTHWRAHIETVSVRSSDLAASVDISDQDILSAVWVRESLQPNTHKRKPSRARTHHYAFFPLAITHDIERKPHLNVPFIE